MADRRLRDGYEALRSQALVSRGHGLGKALLEQRGMAVWMRAWGRELTREPMAPAAPADAPPLQVAAPPEMVGVLATMILSCSREVAT